ncbi:MAG: tyrosine-protein phosphatase, partial [Candidatus Dormibacteraeota bacterium]|nr:tyrosine-protein phosphatase [Candidatus Dormibacteraeota bacterium]
MDEAEETAAGSAPQIEGAVNFRDLGGYRTSDGRTVRPGLVYRSGMLGRLTDAGVDELAGLGLRLVVDFRTTAEATAWPDRLPDPAPRLLA